MRVIYEGKRYTASTLRRKVCITIIRDEAGRNVAVGTAIKAPKDSWDATIGSKLSFDRALEDLKQSSYINDMRSKLTLRDLLRGWWQIAKVRWAREWREDTDAINYRKH